MSDGAHEHAGDEAILSRLRETPLFADLDEGPLRRLVGAGEIVDVAAGDVLIREGEGADALYVVLDGELEVTKRSGRSEIPVTRVGPGSLQGEIAALEGGRRLASVRAVTAAEAFRIPVSAMRDLLVMGPDVALTIIRTVVGRIRALEATLREREKLAALGTLSAGLAHELNNPAAAAMRSVEGLDAAVRSAESLPHPTPPPRPPPGTPPASGLERSDRVEELTTLTGDPEAAAALADAGWTREALAALAPEVRAWVAADASVHQLLGELRLALGRMQEIVAAVKGFSYLDRAPIGRVDVRIGIEQTLVILRHRLKEGIEVRLELADDLPEIEAYGAELNQVWTNLVDNAVDAMEGRGTLTVRAEADGPGGVRVTICDTGSGIAPEVRARLFEPFATTKPPGRGTGLGLHISHNVVVRHGGRIDVESEPGRTCFAVSLPARPPELAEESDSA